MRGKRTRLSTGIYKDASGVSIVVSVRGTPREFRYGASKTTEWLRSERKRLAATETLKSERRHATTHTLRADVERYLLILSGRPKEDADDLLAHWLTAFGDRMRHDLTALELREHAATWTCAPSTFNHRRQALISLYTALDGKQASNPARDIPKRKESLGAPRALPYDVIDKVFEKMPPSQSRARLKVMAYTGLPQMQIEKLIPEDFDGKRLRVTPRRKGAGAHGRWIPLAPEAKAALKEFAAMECWGTFSRSSLWKRWTLYAPPGTNPYSLRHSWITELYRRANGDVIALQQLTLHSRLEQIQRYAAAALNERMIKIVERSTNAIRKPSKRLQITPRSHRGKKR